MLNFAYNNPEKNNLEFLVRTAIAFGELSPGAEAEIKRLVIEGELTVQDCTMLSILKDAIADGCVHRVKGHNPSETQAPLQRNSSFLAP